MELFLRTSLSPPHLAWASPTSSSIPPLPLSLPHSLWCLGQSLGVLSPQAMLSAPPFMFKVSMLGRSVHVYYIPTAGFCRDSLALSPLLIAGACSGSGLTTYLLNRRCLVGGRTAGQLPCCHGVGKGCNKQG